MSKLQIRVLSSNRQVKLIDLAAASRIPAEKGAIYSVVDQATGKPAEGIVLKKNAGTLVVEKDNQVLVEIDNFYADNQQAAFDVSPVADGQATGTAESLVTAMTPPAGESNIVWQAANISTEAAGFGVAGYLLGGALLVGGIAAASGGGGSGGGSSGSTASTAPAVTNNTVSGTVVGGPVVSSNDLKVVIYRADGITVLGEGIVEANGRFTVQIGDYVGVVIAKLFNQGTGADYLDEATGATKDLNAQLFSTGVVTSPNTALTLNINPLTTVAYQEAVQLAAGAPLSATNVNTANQAIAAAFGIDDLQATTVITTNGNTTFNAADGLSPGETYGAILASLSGTDQNNGGNSQTTIDNLVAVEPNATGAAQRSYSAYRPGTR